MISPGSGLVFEFFDLTGGQRNTDKSFSNRSDKMDFKILSRKQFTIY